MTTRETSRIAYAELTESGALKGKQSRILCRVIDNGPATAAEILAGSDLDRNRNLARARFTELQARGLIREVGQRKCKITGRLALVWEFTGRTKPLDIKKGYRPITQAQRERVAKVLQLHAVATNIEIPELATKVIEAVHG